jgi:hypothetical protein
MSRQFPPHLAAQFAELGRRCGVDPLALDDRGVLALCFGERLEVQFVCCEPLHELFLYCEVATLPARPSPQVLIDLLQFNSLDLSADGLVVGLSDEQPPQVAVRQRLAWRGLQTGEFADAVEAFVSVLEDIEVLCREGVDGTPDWQPGSLPMRG